MIWVISLSVPVLHSFVSFLSLDHEHDDVEPVLAQKTNIPGVDRTLNEGKTTCD